MSEGIVHAEHADTAQADETRSTRAQAPSGRPVKEPPWPSWFSEIGRWRADVQR